MFALRADAVTKSFREGENVVTHDPRVRRVADRVARIEAGRTAA